MEQRRENNCILMGFYFVLFFVLASYALPVLIDMSFRDKQRSTTDDMRNTGSAWLSWLTDQVGARSAGQNKMYRTDGHEIKTYEEMRNMLIPNYMNEVPRHDGWGNDLVFTLNRDLAAPRVMAIFSPGRCGKYDIDPAPNTAYPIFARDVRFERYEHDLIWADGYFVQWLVSGFTGGQMRWSLPKWPRLSCS